MKEFLERLIGAANARIAQEFNPPKPEVILTYDGTTPLRLIRRILEGLSDDHHAYPRFAGEGDGLWCVVVVTPSGEDIVIPPMCGIRVADGSVWVYPANWSKGEDCEIK